MNEENMGQVPWTIEEELKHQIFCTRLKDLTEDQLREFAVEIYGQIAHKKNLFQALVDRPTRDELNLSLDINNYRVTIQEVKNKDDLIDIVKVLHVEDIAWVKRSSLDLKNTWGL